MEDRIPAIKSRYSVLEVMQADYPNVFRASSLSASVVSAYSPFSEGHRRALRVTDDWWYDHRLNKGGDIFDYIQERDGCTRAEAIEILAAGLDLNNAPPRRTRRASSPKEPNKPKYDMGQVLEWHARAEEAAPYFIKRGVGQSQIDRHSLGIMAPFTSIFKDDIGMMRFNMPRFAIPNMRDGELIDIDLRRNDRSCLDQFIAMDDRLKLRVTRAIANEQKINTLDVTEKHVLERVFGPKYWSNPGTGRMFNAGRVCFLEDGVLHHYRVPICLLVESRITAMSLEARGFPAVAAKYKHGLNFAQAMQGCMCVVVLGDNDADGAGENYARQMVQHLESNGVTSFYTVTPSPYNDPNEMLVASPDELDKWLRKYGAVPVLNEPGGICEQIYKPRTVRGTHGNVFGGQRSGRTGTNNQGR